MRRSRALISLAATAAALFATATPALAAGTGKPVITSPTYAQQVAYNWKGPVTVDFANAPADQYQVEVECGDYGNYDQVTGFNNDGSAGSTFSWTLPAALPASDSCSIAVSDLTTGVDAEVLTNFTTAAPPPPPFSLSNAAVSPVTFYPLVRDGYADSTRFSYKINRTAQVVATVTANATGRRVKKVALGSVASGTRSWAWNGTNDAGSKVATGGYTITMAATSSGKTLRAARSVKVATANRVSHHWASRNGIQGSPATKGNCNVERDNYYEVSTLDCWGGSYAQMTYNFSIPAAAYNLQWHIVTQLGDNDICCQGNVLKIKARPTPTHAYARVKVTGWRAADVGGVVLEWDTKRRI